VLEGLVFKDVFEVLVMIFFGFATTLVLVVFFRFTFHLGKIIKPIDEYQF